MSRIIRAAVTQCALLGGDLDDPAATRQAMVDYHLAFLEQAAYLGVQVVCFQELFYAPYFPAEQSRRWQVMAESADDGPTVSTMRKQAARYEMVLVVPLFEQESPGVCYNTAVVIDADGTMVGRYRKAHIPQREPACWEKYHFRPGNLGYPVFRTRAGRIGVYLGHDRHFPEGARALGLKGAELVFIPASARLQEGLSHWFLTGTAHACANGYYVGCANRTGREPLSEASTFSGSSFFCDPDGDTLARASRERSELIWADLDLGRLAAHRTEWGFYRDRRPDTYHDLLDP